MAISTSVSTAVAQTVSFLTRPLMQAYPAAIIGRLQLVLEANLTAHYAPSWTPHAPLNGSGRRCISFSQDCLPPRVVYSACLAAGVQWFDWIKLLGIHEFDLFVDPGCVYIRIGKDLINIWTTEPQDVIAPIPRIRISTHTTAAQQLLQDDDADSAIFELIADEMNAPTWKTPMVERFPIPRVSSPFSTLSSVSSHSRCSSRSSNYSSVFSDSDSSTSSSSTSTSYSRREKTRVFVDTTKTEVTPYDGGKTTVLTGGVMLGGAAASKAKHPKASTGNWRCVHVSA